MDYHLSIAGERSGPHTQFQIIDGIREGRYKGEELAWRLGLPDWQPLRTLADFESFWPVSEETKQQAEAARQLARTELDRPRPWMRFWARVLDYLWFIFGVSVLLGPVMPRDPVVFLENPFLRYFPWATLTFLVYVPLEAWMLSRFGTTPGRALLRVQVRRLDGGLPTFRQALRRSFQVFIRGVALMLIPPFLQFFSMMWCRLALDQRGVVSWDEENETRVEHGEPEAWRYFVLTGVIVGVFMTFLLILGQLDPTTMSRLPK